MTTLNIPLDPYDVAIGLDLTFGIDGDLAIDKLDRDLATVSGATAVSASIRRRLTTPPEAYARLIKTSDYYLEPIGLNYGSMLAQYLASPISSTGLTDDLLEEVTLAVRSDLRVQDAQVYLTEASNVKSQLSINLNYRLQPVDNLNNTNLSVGEFRVSEFAINKINQNQQLIIPVET